MNQNTLISLLLLIGTIKADLFSGGFQCRDLSDRCIQLLTTGICQTMSANLCARTCGQCNLFSNQQQLFPFGNQQQVPYSYGQPFGINVKEGDKKQEKPKQKNEAKVFPHNSKEDPILNDRKDEEKPRPKRQILPFPGNSKEIPYEMTDKRPKRQVLPFPGNSNSMEMPDQYQPFPYPYQRPFPMDVKKDEEKPRPKRQILPFPGNSNSMEIPDQFYPYSIGVEGKSIDFSIRPPQKPMDHNENEHKHKLPQQPRKRNEGPWDQTKDQNVAMNRQDFPIPAGNDPKSNKKPGSTNPKFSVVVSNESYDGNIPTAFKNEHPASFPIDPNSDHDQNKGQKQNN